VVHSDHSARRPSVQRHLIFLINLDRSKDRLAQIRSQARQIGLDCVRVRGVDGVNGLPGWLHGEFAPDAGLTCGEIGCYASHLSICKLVRDHDLGPIIVIEDDILFDVDFLTLSAKAIEAAPDGWDIIHFSTKFKKPAYPIAPIGPEHAIVRYSRLPANSAAYAVSPSGASKLLAPGRRDFRYDMEFRYAWLRGLDVYGVYPPLAQQRPGCRPLSNTARAEGGGDKVGLGKAQLRKKCRPGLFSQLRGLCFVKRRLGLNGLLYCWSRELMGYFVERTRKNVIAVASGHGTEPLILARRSNRR
jgi:glycosyl transferase, family 25